MVLCVPFDLVWQASSWGAHGSVAMLCVLSLMYVTVYLFVCVLDFLFG